MTTPGRPLADALAEVRERVAAAERRSGRAPGAVTLVAATKTVPVVRIAEVVGLGVLDVGENRAQELLAKAPALAGTAPAPRWHFLGTLQRNKVRALVPWVCCWHSLDRAELAVELARRAPGTRVLVEVNLGREATKAGCDPAGLTALVALAATAGLEVAGLMTVPPRDGEPRRWFARLRELAVEHGLAELSMGMSDDFEIAVEEGATMVRLGRVLFGARP